MMDISRKTSIRSFRMLDAIILILTISLVAAMQGCTVGKDYQQPKMDMPEQWSQDSAGMFSAGADPNLAGWWTIFGDPQLDALIQQALVENRSIQAAVYRLEASRAMWDYAAGQYYPSVDATGSYSRIKVGKDGTIQSHDEIDPINLHSAGFDFMWEIDLFGRIKRSVESAEASYQASVEDCRDVMVTLLAEVCRNYIDLRTIQARIVYANENVDIQQRTLELTRSRFQYELTGELDVRQAESNLASTKSELHVLKISEAAAIHRLGVLLGQMPMSLKDSLGTFKAMPTIGRQAVLGVPADVLRNRPDIRRAERQLAAQTARIGVATADLYPSLQLVGTFEIQSRKLSGLGNIHNQAYSVGPGVRWNLFDGNRIRNAIKVEEAAAGELLANWENTVLLAAEDVENAIVSYGQQQQRQVLLAESVQASVRSVELVENLYQTGLTDFQNVLVTQRSLFVQQDQLAASQGEVLQSLVRLYKGFGGGWQISETQETVAQAQPATN